MGTGVCTHVYIYIYIIFLSVVILSDILRARYICVVDYHHFVRHRLLASAAVFNCFMVISL